MNTLLFPLAVWVVDDRARAFASDVRDAIDAVLTRSEAASLMRLTNKNEQPNVAELSAQLNCQKPLNVFRLTALPDAFWDALAVRQADRRGGMYLAPPVVELLRGAAKLGPKRMLKVSPSAERQIA